MVVVRHEWGETDREVVAGASVVAMAWWWVPVNEHMGRKEAGGSNGDETQGGGRVYSSSS